MKGHDRFIYYLCCTATHIKDIKQYTIIKRMLDLPCLQCKFIVVNYTCSEQWQHYKEVILNVFY